MQIETTLRNHLRSVRELLSESQKTAVLVRTWERQPYCRADGNVNHHNVMENGRKVPQTSKAELPYGPAPPRLRGTAAPACVMVLVTQPRQRSIVRQGVKNVEGTLDGILFSLKKE